MKYLPFKELFCAATGLAPGLAAAGTIDFNGMGTNFTKPVTGDGYTFDYLGENGWGIGSISELSFNVGNGTEQIGCRNTGDFQCAISMERADASAFSIQTFSLGDHSLGFGGTDLAVTFTLFGGRSFDQIVTTIADVMTSFTAVDPMASLSSVLFTWNGARGNDGFALDDLVVDELDTALIPLPAARPFLLEGLGGLGVVRRCTSAA